MNKARWPTWKLALVALALLALPIGVYVLAMDLPSGLFGKRRMAAEARLNVRTLCRLVVRHREQQGEWRAAGPEPSRIPVQPVLFPKNADFEALGFSPGEVRYQYQVEVEQNDSQVKTVRCIARGDLDGDGVPSQFFIYLNTQSREIGQLETADELD